MTNQRKSQSPDIRLLNRQRYALMRRSLPSPACGTLTVKRYRVLVKQCEKRAIHGQIGISVDLQAHGGWALRWGQGYRVLGSRTLRLRGPGLSLRRQGLCRADPRAGKVKTRHPRAARSDLGRSGPPQGGHDHCTHQGGRRPLAHSIRFGWPSLLSPIWRSAISRSMPRFIASPGRRRPIAGWW